MPDNSSVTSNFLSLSRSFLSVISRYGPDRALFLPGGLYDPSEVPDYLNGTLAGE